MAGDWIKMRGELATHPRLLAMANELVYGDGDGLLIYVCGADALGIGTMPPSQLTVTERALRCVTEQALRDVTLCALLRVWCAVNAHCKVAGNDAVMQPMGLPDVDVIAGFPGFSTAMQNAGWVVDDASRNCLVFPNFLDFNEPACIRVEPKTNAQRQKEWRERQKAAGEAATANVTRRNESNGREEKRREDKNTPISPQGGKPSNGFCKGFLAFWQPYPLKAGKQAAYRAWTKAGKRIREATGKTSTEVVAYLADRAKAFAASPKGSGDFVPNPATWLNQGRYDDDPAAWQKGGKDVDDAPLLRDTTPKYV